MVVVDILKRARQRARGGETFCGASPLPSSFNPFEFWWRFVTRCSTFDRKAALLARHCQPLSPPFNLFEIDCGVIPRCLLSEGGKVTLTVCFNGFVRGDKGARQRVVVVRGIVGVGVRRWLRTRHASVTVGRGEGTVKQRNRFR